MLNAERFRKEILENSNVVFDFSISKDRHTIEKCLGVCDNCIFCNIGEHCSNVKVKWLLSEYKEPVKLSKLEYEFLKWSEKKGHKYIVRDKINHLFIFKDAPIKRENCWVPESSYCSIALFDNLFKFIKQEDEEPIAIKDILENCEVVNDAEE